MQHILNATNIVSCSEEKLCHAYYCLARGVTRVLSTESANNLA